ncbi:MAG: hypothetical protein J6N71_09200 [Muribaculaceae bacterium]|nr:hypothetical protein [Muribaculaceae bacterium]
MIANIVPFSEFCNKITLSFSSVQTLPVFFHAFNIGKSTGGPKTIAKHQAAASRRQVNFCKFPAIEKKAM